MNKQALLIALFATAALSGCLDSDGTGPGVVAGMQDMEPSYDSVQPATTTALMHVAQLVDDEGNPFPTGAGIWVFGDYVFGSARSERFFIADISNPAEPELVFQAPEDSITGYARDADVIVHEDGHRTLVLATQNDGMHFWDVTNPRNPEYLSRIFVHPNHNVAVIPGTTWVFNSQSGGEGGFNEIIDASNPRVPRLINAYGTHGCHDITFWGSFGDEKFRGYCAGIDRTEIWDLSNLDPAVQRAGIEVLGVVDFNENPADSPVVGNPAFAGYPVRTLHHLAMVNEDASVLIIGDEQNGGGTPGGCIGYDENTGTASPTGALWFYDLSDETDPVLVAWLSPPTVTPAVDPAAPDPSGVDPNDPGTLTRPLRPYTAGVPNCTAHFGTLVPGEEKMVMAWYSAGVLLIDFSDPSSPRILDQYQPEGTNPWDARIHGGYVFTGDIGRGMDVLKLV